MDFTKLVLNANSCYMDSLFIFILLYKNTHFFSKFYEINLNKNKKISNSLKKDTAINKAFENLPLYFTDLYNNICKNNNSSNVAACRINIRKTLNYIGKNIRSNTNMQAGAKTRIRYKKKKKTKTSKVGNIGKRIKKFERNWLTDQQDSSELLEFLMYIYNINTNISYDINKYYDYNSKNKKYKEICKKKYITAISKLDAVHRADYIGNKFDYHVTTNVESFKLFSNTIKDPIADGIDPYSIITKPDALIEFNKWDVINLTHRPAEKTPNDAFILVNYKISSSLPIFIIQVNRLLEIDNIKNFNGDKIPIPEYITNPNNDNANNDNTNNDNKYLLIGGTIHNGGTDGGHYTAYILNPATDTYFHYNNSGGDWNAIGSYDDLMKTEFTSQCTLLFYISKTEYNTQKTQICQVTQENTESSSYEITDGNFTDETETDNMLPIFTSVTDEPDITHQQEPDITHQQEPDITHQQEPDITHQQEPDITHQQEPDITHQQEPDITHHKEPAITHQQEPDITHQQEPTIKNKMQPKITHISTDKINFINY